jgi:hypothetical protein
LLATPALNHRATSSRGIKSSATAGTGAPQVAGRRINPLEASSDLAAARAQTVWGRHESPSPNPSTRRRSHRLHISQADYSCRKRQSRLRTLPINGSRQQDYPRRWASSRVHCIGLLGVLKEPIARNGPCAADGPSGAARSRIVQAEDALKFRRTDAPKSLENRFN